MNRIIEQLSNSELLNDSNLRLLVGVSGGVDSVVLLHALYSIGVDCVVAHCNFHLRGEDSNADERFVEQLANRFSYPIEIVNFDTEVIANNENISIEMAARKLRYTWFEEVREKYYCDYIAVAHNANDAVETFFLNIVRGTGIKGMVGMPMLRDKIFRPLIEVTREEIEKYARDNNMQWQTDYTNQETIYYRNKIRHKIVPVLEELNPSFLKTMKNNMSYLTDVQQVFLHYSDIVKEECLWSDGDQVVIDVLKLREKVSYQTLLFEWLHNIHMPIKLIQQVIVNIDMQTGKRFETEDYIVVKDRNRLLIDKKRDIIEESVFIHDSIEKLDSPITLQFSLKLAPFVIQRDKNIALLDASALEFPLELRLWQAGDIFNPFGMKGRKKVSDYLTDNKKSVLEKRQTYVLLSGKDIVWVVGERIDGRYAVSANTEKAVEIKLF